MEAKALISAESPFFSRHLTSGPSPRLEAPPWGQLGTDPASVTGSQVPTGGEPDPADEWLRLQGEWDFLNPAANPRRPITAAPRAETGGTRYGAVSAATTHAFASAQPNQ